VFDYTARCPEEPLKTVDRGMNHLADLACHEDTVEDLLLDQDRIRVAIDFNHGPDDEAVSIAREVKRGDTSTNWKIEHGSLTEVVST